MSWPFDQAFSFCGAYDQDTHRNIEIPQEFILYWSYFERVKFGLIIKKAWFWYISLSSLYQNDLNMISKKFRIHLVTESSS